jgi:GT2 family glycosyltransferase
LPRAGPAADDPGVNAPLDVTATICNYNGRAYLGDCLRALLEQTRPPVRVVVYDNASSDGSAAFVREQFPQVEVVEMGSNLGPGAPRNRGLQEARTELVLQVDSDVILAPDCLERLHAELIASDAAIAMPRAVFDSDRARVHYDGGAFHYVGVMTLRNFFRVRPPPPAAGEPPLDVDAVISMALLVRKDKVIAAGAYDVDYFILFEDHDLSYRLRARGERLRLVPEAVVYHREGTAGLSYRDGPAYPERRAFLHSRNRWRLLLRNHSAAALLLGLPGILAYEVVWLGFAVAKGLLRPYLRGKRELFAQLPRLLTQRRAIQHTRVVSDRVLLQAQPLTHAPMVKQGAVSRATERLLDATLRGWWWLVRPLLP